jgi:alkylation response protein AidB-like acyl-CoA dehydrogenase
VNFSLSDEQVELRSVVRRFLAEHASESETRRLMASDTGYDPAVWAQLAGQLGLVGLAVPEEYGGAGFGWVELGVVFEEMGRALLCAPYFATVALAIPALLASGDAAACADHLPSVVAGKRIATLALTEPAGRWDSDGVTLRAEQHDGVWRLDGLKTYVPDGAVADLVLVVARSDAGIGLFAVEGTAPGLARRSLPTLDQTRKQAELRFDAVEARLVGQDGSGWAAIEEALRRAAVALSAEQVGSAQRALDLAVEHAKVRTQFGRPIGSFQAVKHLCSEMLLEVESARSAAYYAMWAADSSPEELPAAASLAQAFCTDALSSVAASCIQVHGGIGFTWEHPAHLYFKRASSSAFLLGDADHHRALFADRVLPA